MQNGLFDGGAITRYSTRAEWDAATPGIVGNLLSRWELSAADTLAGGVAGVVIGVIRGDGTPAVLKVGYPHEEGAAEALGLASFPPGTAPRVLRQDAIDWAMLLERIEPGTSLLSSSVHAAVDLTRAGTLLGRLHDAEPLSGIPLLADVIGGQAVRASARLDGGAIRLGEVGVHDAVDLVAAALDHALVLIGSADSASVRLVHGDFNPTNVLVSDEGLVAIDPKPMVGDPAYDLWPLVSQLHDPFSCRDPAERLRSRLTIVADAAGVDMARAARWCVARSGLSVSWCLEDDELAAAAAEARKLEVWTRVAAGIRSSR